MARRGKSNGEHTDGNGAEALNGGANATRLDKLPSIAARIDSAKAVSDDARSELGNIYQQAENDGFHRRALKEAVRLRNMEPDNRRDYLSSLNAYCDQLGIWNQGELFGDQPRVPSPAPLAELSPYDLGRSAAHAGAETSANPFTAGAAEHGAWSEGWLNGWNEQNREDPGNTVRKLGYNDGIKGNRSFAADYGQDHAHHADYELGWQQGQRELVEKRHGPIEEPPVSSNGARRRGRPRKSEQQPGA